MVPEAPEPEYAPVGSRPGGRPFAVSRSEAGQLDPEADGAGGNAAWGRRGVGRGGGHGAGVRLRFHGGLLPKSVWGRVAMGCLVLGVAAAVAAAIWQVRSFLTQDAHFVVEGPSAIEISGNAHLTRAQLLTVFGSDVRHNIFGIPLAQRRVELQRLPWVSQATVMRLLPNRVRVSVVERTPVAFVRQGGQIGLVDGHGVLLDMGHAGEDGRGPAGEAGGYSFPVLTGISAKETASERAARMQVYLAFAAALDADGQNLSRRLSEVDLSNPEDVRAMLPDLSDDRGGSSAADSAAGIATGVLVHFGAEKFLERYRRYAEHLAEWRTQYPRLASVDLRYERQVVLQMQPGAATSSPPTGVKPVAARPKVATVLAPAGIANGLHPTHDAKAVMNGAAGSLRPDQDSKPATSGAPASSRLIQDGKTATRDTTSTIRSPHIGEAVMAKPSAPPPAQKIAVRAATPAAGGAVASGTPASSATVQPPVKHLTTAFPVNAAGKLETGPAVHTGVKATAVGPGPGTPR